jgi:hypothetical protein
MLCYRLLFRGAPISAQAHFKLVLDGKVSKTICRLWFSSSKKCIGILDAEGKEARKQISSLDEIYGVAGILKDRAKYLIQDNSVKDAIQMEKSEK